MAGCHSTSGVVLTSSACLQFGGIQLLPALRGAGGSSEGFHCRIQGRRRSFWSAMIIRHSVSYGSGTGHMGGGAA